ncbi:MAG: universal stress protein [Alphaproteobacteria bacterium]
MSEETYVVAYEGDDRSVLDFAIARAKKIGASLHIVHILQWSPYSFLTQEELAERHKRRQEELARAEAAIVKPAVAAARAAGIEAVTSDIRYGSVADLIAEIAKEKGATFIYVGRSGGGSIAARVFGSVPIALAQISTVPVVIVP